MNGSYSFGCLGVLISMPLLFHPAWAQETCLRRWASLEGSLRWMRGTKNRDAFHGRLLLRSFQIGRPVKRASSPGLEAVRGTATKKGTRIETPGLKGLQR